MKNHIFKMCIVNSMKSKLCSCREVKSLEEYRFRSIKGNPLQHPQYKVDLPQQYNNNFNQFNNNFKQNNTSQQFNYQINPLNQFDYQINSSQQFNYHINPSKQSEGGGQDPPLNHHFTNFFVPKSPTFSGLNHHHQFSRCFRCKLAQIRGVNLHFDEF